MSKPKRPPNQAELLARARALIADGRVSDPCPRPWFVYLLECNGGRVYTGIAVDVARRVALHQTGKGARFTRMHLPQALLGSFRFRDRAAASRAEAAIKRLDAPRKRALLTPTHIDDTALGSAEGAVIENEAIPE